MLDVLSNKQAGLLNKESPTFKNLRVGTGLQLAQQAINALAGAGQTNETIKGNADAIVTIKGAGWTNETIKGNADAIAGRVSLGIAAGTNIDVVDISAISPAVTSIVAILAITTASGAAAVKLLLEEIVDYTFAAGVLTTVTDQSANTLIIFYK